MSLSFSFSLNFKDINFPENIDIGFVLKFNQYYHVCLSSTYLQISIEGPTLGKNDSDYVMPRIQWQRLEIKRTCLIWWTKLTLLNSAKY